MSNIIAVISFIFVLGVIIAVHEWGHYIFAKRAGILVREFAFGMGPQIIKKKKGETVYSLRAFPIGGFCAIAGEETENDPFKEIRYVRLDIKGGVIKAFYLDDLNDSLRYPTYEIINYELLDQEQTGELFMRVWKDQQESVLPVDPQALVYTRKLEYQIAPYNRTIGSKSKRARAMVMFGGPLMNFLLAIVVFFIAALIQGFPVYESSELANMTTPSEGETATPAYVAGLRNGDVITHLKSGSIVKEVAVWNDISLFMDEYTKQGNTSAIEVTYLRNDVTNKVNVQPQVMIYNIGVAGEFTENGIKVLGVAYTKEGSKLSDNRQLKANDIITHVNGKSYLELSNIYSEFENYVGNNENETLNFITITVLRNSTSMDVQVKPYSKKIMETQTTNEGDIIPIVKVAMGVSPVYRFNLAQSFKYSGQRTIGSFTAIIDTFDLLFTDRSVTIDALSGPVGIFGITKSVAAMGFAPLLNWMGLLSVNIGLINLLPIPALDGGRLVFLGYEAITKKKPNQKLETALITITMFLLFGLMIYITFNEIFG